jgi:hypothetical protein
MQTYLDHIRNESTIKSDIRSRKQSFELYKLGQNLAKAGDEEFNWIKRLVNLNYHNIVAYGENNVRLCIVVT